MLIALILGMIGIVRVLIGNDRQFLLDSSALREVVMTIPKKQAPELKNSRKSTQQRKIRLQQVILAVIGIIVIVSMVLALAMNY